MSEEINDFQPTFVKVPDFNQMMSQTLSQRVPPPTIPKNGFDPHAVMVNRKKMESGNGQVTTPSVSWPEQDIKTLEDFCKQHGIIGFNCGRMSPIAALCLLKSKLGIVDNNPLEQRYNGQKTLLKG
jgi:hypothetical protein